MPARRITMLVTVLALQLVLAQSQPAVEPPRNSPAREETAPPERPFAEERTRRSVEPQREPEAREPATAKEPERAEEEGGLKTTRELPSPGRMRTRQIQKSALNPIPSLLSAEPLGGRSAVLGWAGWSAFGAGWAQGVTPEDDLGAVADLDWSTGELRISAFYRRPLGRVGLVDIGSRLRAGWYADFGAKWMQDDNVGDRGVEFVPGIVLSTRGAGGVFSVGGDLPITVTLWREGGIFAAPKLSLSYETLLYGDLSVGVRVAGSYRAGAGDAPMSSARALLDLQVLAGWKIL
jgi:hypothetical protein